jgi:hypothetical protein
MGIIIAAMLALSRIISPAYAFRRALKDIHLVRCKRRDR